MRVNIYTRVRDIVSLHRPIVVGPSPTEKPMSSSRNTGFINMPGGFVIRVGIRYEKVMDGLGVNRNSVEDLGELKGLPYSVDGYRVVFRRHCRSTYVFRDEREGSAGAPTICAGFEKDLQQDL